jgi:hypothetical protein
MFQTSYTGIKPLQRNYTYVGGFCRFWYIAVEDIAVFPRVSPSNQWLVDEPLLVADKAWFGPIQVPKDKLGYVESMKKSKAGIYYETKVEGIHIGDSPDSRVNLENMPFHKYLVVAKVRAGGYYHLIGTDKSPLEFNADFKSGIGPIETAQTILSFITEHINKAYVLPNFNADTIAPDTGGGGEDPGCMNQKEIIPFEEQATVNIPWTPIRQSKFGSFPVIDVYVQEEGEPPTRVVGGSIEADQAPPAFTELSVKLGGNPSGFIVIT